MDTFGVPKKINRHVIKAIYKLTNQKNATSDLSSICNVVEFQMKNCVPVPNFTDVVQKSLRNMRNLGIIEKQGLNYCRASEILTQIHGTKRAVSKTLKRAILDAELDTLKPMNKKRRLISKESTMEYPECSNLHHRQNKLLSRKGVRVNLPKVRNYADLKLAHDDQIGQVLGSISNNSFGINSDNEKENDTIFSSIELKPQYDSKIFKTEEVQEIDKIHESFDVLNESPDDSDKTQNDQLNKLNDASIHDRSNELDVFNEIQPQLSENVSEYCETQNHTQKDLTDFDNKEDDVNDMTIEKNINDIFSNET